MRNKITFVGRSNVGKSSTIKALTGAKLKVGRRPGITLEPMEIPYGGAVVLDMPGFGFMMGISKKKQEDIKNFIVRYLENSGDVLFAVQVTDAKAFVSIALRWLSRGHVPLEVEMHQFLREVNLEPLLVANKMDKIPLEKRSEVLDEICSLLNLEGPWANCNIIPFSARTGEGLPELKKALRVKLNRHIR
jgi:GTP-binding protein EngB required for normal cell division